jgi:predicted Zn-dependent protease with MMP-like domain
MSRWSEEVEREVDAFLEEFEELFETDPETAFDLARKLQGEVSEHPDVKLARIRAVWALHGADAARSALLELTREQPDFADAHHILALVYEELGDQRGQVEESLSVLALDAAQDAAEGLDPASSEDFIVQAAEQALERLPSPFRERLQGVPILIEPRPSRALVEQGFDPRALGLFDGPIDEERAFGEANEQPTRIVLYSANLLASFPDPDELRYEVEVTVRHEIGHFFGLEEDDLERLGLE